ncbi:hypothetical protein ABG067_006426 [Albugo candida]
MLLHQVAESVCSTAVALPTRAFKLPNPFMQLKQMIPLESIGVLHISLWGPEWCKKDMFILPNVIRNVGPLQEHKHTTLGDLRT